MKLFYKLFGAFILISVGILTIWITTFYLTLSKNFREYVNKLDLGVQYKLIQELKTIYVKTNSWDAFKDDPVLWFDILSNMFIQRLPEPPPTPFQLTPPFEIDKVRRNLVNMDRKTRYQFLRSVFKGTSSLGAILLDENRALVTDITHPEQVQDSTPLMLEDFTLKPIVIDYKTVGWLGLKKNAELKHPVDIAFIKKQSDAIIVVSILILLLSSIVSFLFSRHLLSPIQSMIQGAKAIADRKFDSRLTVKTTDELGELASNFNTMAQTLENYEDQRKQWITDISHELGTPLSILRGEIEAIQDGIRKPDPSSIESLHSETMRLSKIVNDLRELSLASTGGMSFDREEIMLSAVVDSTVASFRLPSSRRNVNIHISETSDCLVIADYSRLQQVLSNILENSLRYMDSPGDIWLGVVEQDYRVLLYVLDSGPGVPDNALPNLFDRLFRVEQSRTRSKGGSGLGLAICKHIIGAFHGTISAKNVEGKGLKIEIILPKHQS